MRQRPSHTQSGFTLIELSLSMAFIAMLLLGIALLTIQISTIYNKGLTMRAVNESGQLIATDIQRTLNTSRPQEVLFVNIVDPSTKQGGGRLCANNVVYAWNYAGDSLTNRTGFNSYNRYTAGGANQPLVRMVRFIGDTTYCTPTNPPNVYKLLPASTDDRLTELLKAGDNTLALQSFDVEKDADDNAGEAVKDDSTQRMYHVSFILGTNESGAPINDNGCAAPESRVDDEYCAVNRFDFVARAGSKGVSE